MNGRYVNTFVWGLLALLALGGSGLAQTQTQRSGPVSQAGLGHMLTAPSAGRPGLSSGVVQEIADFTCANPNTGAPIPVVSDRNLKNIAVSRRLKNGDLEIYFNPKYLGLFQPPMIDGNELQTIENEVSKLTGGGFYKTGPQRAKWIDGCVVQAVADMKSRPNARPKSRQKN